MAFTIISHFLLFPHSYHSSRIKSCCADSIFKQSCRLRVCRFSSTLPMLHRRRGAPRGTTTRIAATEDAGAREEGRDRDDQRVGPDLETLFRRFWKVASPYWSSEDKIQARLKLAAVFALTLATTGISVGFNFLGRDFYNALANKDQEQFTKQLLYYLGAFAGGIPIFVLRDYAKDTLSLRWRSWMTSYYLERYLKNRTFYKIQSQSIIDNPDQRIVDDLSSFTGTALAFSLTVFNAAVDLISFSNILYGIYPPLFVVLIVYSLGGTAVSVFLGKGLVNLNFMQEKKEADFRYALVRVRENAESIAFYGGENNEKQVLLDRFKRAFENLSQLLISSRNLEFFTSGYRYLIQILPAAVVAPMYFSGKIEFGVINQSVSAFNHILSDFSLIVYQFQSLSAFSAIIDRLGEFDDVLDGLSNDSKINDSEEIILQYSDICIPSSSDYNGSIPKCESKKLLEVSNLTLQTPRTRTILIKDLSIIINEGDHLLITGPSGSGKTSFLRALAGLWTSGRGKISFYVEDGGHYQVSASSGTNSLPENTSKDEDLKGHEYGRAGQVFFLPQRPYMALGTLRQQLLYPRWSENSLLRSTNSALIASSSNQNHDMPTVEDLIHALKLVSLGDIISRFEGLDSVHEWSSVLSLGEQQRLAFARLLLAKPKFVLLDESTSALDEANEAHLYSKIEAAGITYISIGHRSTLLKYHNKLLNISKFDDNKIQQNWQLKPIGEAAKPESIPAS
ncbi:ABC transporter D family member 2, chloroplastic [Phalaenopsis equestris]|uniref:ABC transporter D family member 2, chloroplastic n=1 Tax=Phalaenopsis equestris TaxID=78828 RepID=UPI0009E28559|nr:ABC transporter D family member 2, chloroplastic [Phalaenopsis equestris]